MKRITICAVGRLKELELRRACDEYYRRCSRRVKIVERELRDNAALQRALPQRCLLVALDERGTQLTSEQFAQKLQQWIAGPLEEVMFVIGGADGLGDPIRDRADLLLSLGSMTFAHRHVRLLLAEQLYRAVSILEGSPYHRGG